jgi:enamine deaminase RidA (YjgF/YER057c/UK114 family)
LIAFPGRALFEDMANGFEERLTALRLELPPPPGPAANTVNCRRSGNLLFVGPHGPVTPSGLVRGKVPTRVSVREARAAARAATLAALSSARKELGSLDRIRQVVSVFGMVNCAPTFTRMPEVLDGSSEVLVELFGDAGLHVRTTGGMAELPFDVAVEVELVLEVD